MEILLKFFFSFSFFVSKERKQVFLLGDFNINFLNYNDHHSKTLIGNIFSNFVSPEIISGNITATISDYLPQFSFVPNILSNSSTQKSSYYETENFNLNKKTLYLTILIKIGLDLLQIDEQNLELNQDELNLSMNSFLNSIDSILVVHASLKKVNKYKLKFKAKPWITPAL